jgi:diguanylate cyclase (GGDEF)-like protein
MLLLHGALVSKPKRNDMQKILIAEDDEKIRRSIRRHLLREGYDVKEAENGKIALELLAGFPADLILLDVMMPEMDGYELCKFLKSKPIYQDIYILMISAKAKPEEITIGMGFGADDYLTKPFNPEVLIDRVKMGLATVEANNRASMDPLTGLYNRFQFNQLFAYELARCTRHKDELSAVILAVDRFGEINRQQDTASDQAVLKGIAAILKQNSRQIDICARYRDEVFVVLLVSTSVQGATVFAERTREIIANYPFPGMTAGSITASFGIATLDKSKEELIERANLALVGVRVLGGNQVKVFT